MKRPILSAVVKCSIVCSWLTWASSLSAQPVLYVDDSASGTKEGSSWCDAYVFLQDALAATEARNNDADPTNDVTEIRVAQGIYKPDRDGSNPEGTGGREATFQLPNGVSLRGGYAGCGAPDPNERDIAGYETILSGDLSGDDDPDGPPGPGGDCCETRATPGCSTADCEARICAGFPSCCEASWEWTCSGIARSSCCQLCASNTTLCDNSYHVVTASGTDRTTVLDGFIITAGNANGPSAVPEGDDRGGGMYIIDGSPTVTNCTLTRNFAVVGAVYTTGGSPYLQDCMFSANIGGGMRVYLTASPTLVNCAFIGNSAHQGGAINSDSALTLTNCTFVGNSGDLGGAILIHRAMRLTNCTFIENSASSGGALYFLGASSTLTNCAFIGNSASKGGAIYKNTGGPTLTNCTLHANTAATGGGMYFTSYGTTRLTNCILWANTDDSGSGETAQLFDNTVNSTSPVVSHSCIQGWTGARGGIGNIGDDPLFVDADGPDGILGNEDDDLHLSSRSPCINAGDNSASSLPGSDFEDEDRIQHCRVDMGIDETPYFAYDCNTNRIADACDTAGGASEDCNENGIPDECDIADGASKDCRGNGNAIPDECEPDCNVNGIADSCDLAENTSADCNGNAIPDECDPDCNANGIPEDCEVLVYGSIVFVDVDATGANSGTSWEDAFKDLQSGLCAARRDPVISQIWVAAGTYEPAAPGGDRSASFELVDAVALYGGFAGAEESLDDRDPVANTTILNGDLNDDDTGGPFDYVDDQINPTRYDNSYHVVTALDVSASTILDGFTIMGGHADEHAGWAGPPNTGGGINVSGGAPTVINCTIAGNWARRKRAYGGGMSCTDDASPIVVNSTFRANFANIGGGGIYTSGGQLALTGCSFVGNAVVSAGGGGLYNDGGRVTATNCIFNGNDGGSHYGGAVLDWGITELTNCLLANNSAWQRGGGIYGGGILTNCTLVNNVAGLGGGIYWKGVLTNCILWNNRTWYSTTPDLFDQLGFGPSSINYSCVLGSTSDLGGVGNIGDDPRFIPGAGGCYYLSQIAAGQGADSPCVDTGSDTAANLGLDALTTRSDEIGDTGAVDMGYHYPSTGTTPVIGDYDRNERIDLSDFAAFQRCFTAEGPTHVSPCCRIFDFDPDADVDLDDAVSFQQAITGP